MTPEQWKRVEEIYYAALDRAEGERSAFLDKACGSDTALRKQIETLLQPHLKAEGLLRSLT
jgi:hypothetical protein